MNAPRNVRTALRTSWRTCMGYCRYTYHRSPLSKPFSKAWTPSDFQRKHACDVWSPPLSPFIHFHMDTAVPKFMKARQKLWTAIWLLTKLGAILYSCSCFRSWISAAVLIFMNAHRNTWTAMWTLIETVLKSTKMHEKYEQYEKFWTVFYLQCKRAFSTALLRFSCIRSWIFKAVPKFMNADRNLWTASWTSIEYRSEIHESTPKATNKGVN